MITDVNSIDDPALSDFINLRSRPTGRCESRTQFVVEGQLLVQRLIVSDFSVRAVVVERGRELSAVGLSEDGVVTVGAVRRDLSVYRLSRDQMRQLAGFDFHRGFLASAMRKPALGIDDVVPDPVSLALVQTSDMENLGSMLRSAAAFGIRQVLIDGQSVDPYSRRAMRVSMGAALGMRFVMMGDPASDLQRLGDRGMLSLAATLAADSKPIDELVQEVDQRAAAKILVMGNEGNGLPIEVQSAASQRVIIPMGGRLGGGLGGDRNVDSLNVSVAAAILMHELTRAVRSGGHR